MDPVEVNYRPGGRVRGQILENYEAIINEKSEWILLDKLSKNANQYDE